MEGSLPKNRSIWRLSILLVTLGTGSGMGCVSSPTEVFIDGESPAKVTRLALGDWQGTGEILGSTPITLPLDQVEGRLLRIQSSGKVPLYWLVTKEGADRIEAKIKLLEDTSGVGPTNAKGGISHTESKSSANRLLRVLLRAYKSLAEGNLKKAQEAADQAIVIDAELAAPYIVKGIVLLKEGDRSGAKQVLTKAQTLDPDDKDIDSLLRSIP